MNIVQFDGGYAQNNMPGPRHEMIAAAVVIITAAGKHLCKKLNATNDTNCFDDALQEGIPICGHAYETSTCSGGVQQAALIRYAAK